MNAIFRALGAPFRVIGAAFRVLLTDAGLKAWALLIAFGCGVSMTLYAAVALYLEKAHAAYVFWLGESAMGIILVVITAFTGLLIKRSVGGTINIPGGGGGSVSFDDK